MKDDWPTQERDLEMVAVVIKKHVDQNGGEPLPFLDVVSDGKPGIVDYVLADWVVEVMDYFVEQYGIEEGQDIMQKVMAKCLLAGQTIH